GWLPRWLRLATIAPRLVNLVARIRPLVAIGLRLAGADPRREVPRFAPRPFRRSRTRWSSEVETPRPKVVLWVDSFTNAFSPTIAEAAIAVLDDAGYDAVLTPRQECCGLTWITTGQLDGARRLLRSSLDALEPFLDAGLPIVRLEPSCTAVLRSDVLELLPDDPRSRRVASATVTLAEFVTAAGWTPPSLEGVEVVAQPHCHQ